MTILLEGKCKVSLNRKRPIISDAWHHNATFRITPNIIKIEYESNKREVRKKITKIRDYVIYMNNIKKFKIGGNTIIGTLFLTAFEPYITIFHKNNERICLHGGMFKFTGIQSKIASILEEKITSNMKNKIGNVVD